MSSPNKIEREDVDALAEAFVKRMRWPSMHWRTQSIDHDAAAALALVALESAPTIIAAARHQERVLAEAVGKPS